MTEKRNINEVSNTNQAIWAAISGLSSVTVSILISIILSRKFSKIDYGTYNQVMYVYNTFLIVFSAGLPNAFSYFLSRESNSSARDLISKINSLLVLLGFIFSVALFFGSGVIADILNNENLETALKYFALVPMLMLPTIGLEGILSTYRKANVLALFTIVTRLFMIILVVGPVLIWNLGLESALIGFTISAGLTFTLALILKYYPTRGFGKGKSTFSYKDISQFAVPLLLAGIWGVVIRASDQFFISHYYGTEVFAEFANGSIELPFVAIFISATSVVLLPVFSKKFHSTENAKEEVLIIWRTVFQKSIKIIYPLVLFCGFFSVEIMCLLFGKEYIGSSNYFRIKLIVNLFTIISYSPIILAIGATKFYNNVHFIGALVLIVLELVSVYTISSPYAITVISVVCQVGRILVMLIFIARYFGISVFQLIPPKLQLEIILPSVIVLFGVRFLMNNFMTGYSNLALLSTGVVVYGMLFMAWVKFRKLDYSFVTAFYKKGNQK